MEWKFFSVFQIFPCTVNLNKALLMMTNLGYSEIINSKTDECRLMIKFFNAHLIVLLDDIDHILRKFLNFTRIIFSLIVFKDCFRRVKFRMQA